ncbi:zinc finger protein 37-like [Planococcus citri]|uniref:zinc finger protein 37-like n=1 Tax=Planococcus citri TaxID=170843 RepID=UPI0031F73FD1
MFQMLRYICSQQHDFGKLWIKLPPQLHRISHDDGQLLDGAHKGYYCPNGCGRKYKYKGNLSQHLKNECGKEKQFECEVCNKRFTHKSTVKKHAYLLHNKIIECSDIKRVPNVNV